MSDKATIRHGQWVSVGYLYIAGTVLFTVYGQLIIKHQVDQLVLPEGASMVTFLVQSIFTRPLILSGFVAAFIASLSWMAALSRFELSFAYPFMAMNFVLVSGLSVVAFNDTVSTGKVLGLLCIVLGVLVVARSG